MNISQNNLFALYHDWLIDDLPNDLCAFFWTSFFGILLSPIVVPGRLWGKPGLAPSFGLGLISWMGYILALGIGMVFTELVGYEYYGFWGHFLLAPLVGGLIVGLIISIIVGAVHIGVKSSETRAALNIKQIAGAAREKYCVKINWK